MSSNYQRATRRFPAVIHHSNGETSEGFLHFPVGVDFASGLRDSGAYLAFENIEGASGYLSAAGIVSIYQTSAKARTAEHENASRQTSNSSSQKKPKTQEAPEHIKEATERARKFSRVNNEKIAKANAEFERRQREAEELKRAEELKAHAAKDKTLTGAFSLFKLPPNAPLSDIQSTYRKLVKECHPDLVRGKGGSDEDVFYSAQRLVRINEAYSIICEAYDAMEQKAS